MVGYAYDLGPRHSARIIEQSVRQRAPVWAETIEQSEPCAFSGFFCSCAEEIVVLQVNGPNPESNLPVAGQYYQILINLGDTRYLTVCDLMDVQHNPEGLKLMFCRPSALQVMQRRRFHRHEPGQAFPVYISWQEIENDQKLQQTPALGQIRDLSLHGMSIRVPNNLDDHLFIGDVVYIRFSLNVRDPDFFTSATICHKEPGSQSSEMIMGLQFVGTEQKNDFQTRLRSALSQRLSGKSNKKRT